MKAASASQTNKRKQTHNNRNNRKNATRKYGKHRLSKKLRNAIEAIDEEVAKGGDLPPKLRDFLQRLIHDELANE